MYRTLWERRKLLKFCVLSLVLTHFVSVSRYKRLGNGIALCQLIKYFVHLIFFVFQNVVFVCMHVKNSSNIFSSNAWPSAAHSLHYGHICIFFSMNWLVGLLPGGFMTKKWDISAGILNYFLLILVSLFFLFSFLDSLCWRSLHNSVESLLCGTNFSWLSLGHGRWCPSCSPIQEVWKTSCFIYTCNAMLSKRLFLR